VYYGMRADELDLHDRRPAHIETVLRMCCRHVSATPVTAGSSHRWLLAIPGCGVLGAAAIVGETAGERRFRSEDAFARFTGTAPVPVWSGSSAGRVRLNRDGNRRMNCALHMIAISQARGIGPGKDYLDKLISRGKTRTEAVRLLRRRLSDTVFAALLADEAPASDSPSQPLLGAA
jgi:transposase